MEVRHCLLTTGSWSQHLQPHRGGSTVGGGSPRYQTVSLFPFFRTCIAAGEPASSSVSSHSLNHVSSCVLAAESKPVTVSQQYRASIPAEGNGEVLEWAGPHCRLKDMHQLLQPSTNSVDTIKVYLATIR